MHPDLISLKLESISPKTAQEMVLSGEAVLLDVRPTEDNAKAYPEVCLCVFGGG